MTRPTCFLLASLLVASGAVAADAEPQFSAATIRAHVAFLSDDLLEGRETGTRGFDIGARYIGAQFAELGLKPAGLNGTWYMPVEFQVRTVAEGASVTISGPAGSNSWRNGTEVILASSAMVQQEDVEAEVVFVGYGIDEPRVGVNDYAGLDVRGRIVVAFAGFPKGMDSETGAHLGRVQAEVAARHGALGLAIIETDQSERTRSWSSRLGTVYSKQMAWVGPDGKPNVDAPIVTGVRLNRPAAEAVFAGAPMSIAELRVIAEQDGGKPKGFPLQARMRIQRNSNWERISSPNIAAVIEGGDPVLKNEYVVLMGHADHLGINPAHEGDKIYNGTLDNAAGIGTLLEVARAVARSGIKPRRSILFFASTGEEKGLLGADYFANHPTMPIENIVGLVNLDMPFLLYDFTDVVAYGADHSTMGRIVRRAAARMDVGLGPDLTPEESIFTRSDHYMFVRQGVPAIMLATGRANGGDAKRRDFLANRYHKPGDDMTQEINWEAGAKFARLNYLITREMSDGDQRPLWMEGDFFGDVFGSGQLRAPK